MSYVLDKRQNNDLISGVLLESPWVVGWAQRKVGLFETSWLLLMNALMPNQIFDLKFTKYSTETSPVYIEKSENCPLYFPYMTPKAYISAMRAITNVRSKCDSWPASLPVILAFGRNDTVLDADALFEFVNGIRRASKNFEVYNYSCGHLLTKGVERAHFLKDMIDFFNSQTKRR
jgi:acylglycerol lipase